MKVTCIKCGVAGRVPDAKIPEKGTTLRCPKCGTRFRVSRQGQRRPAPSPVSSRGEERRLCRSCGVASAGADGLCDRCRTQAGNRDRAESAGADTSGTWGSCALCGKALPDGELVRIGRTTVCGRCKPDYVRRLSQGLTVPGNLRFAGFWIRAGAKIVDWMVQWVLNMVVSIPLSMVMAFTMPAAESSDMAQMGMVLLMTGVMWLIQLSVPAAYSTYFIGRFGATPGKMLCGIKVVTGEGEAVSYPRALGRHFAEMLSMIFFIGYIMVAFDREKRGLHDMICNTRVVYK